MQSLRVQHPRVERIHRNAGPQLPVLGRTRCPDHLLAEMTRGAVPSEGEASEKLIGKRSILLDELITDSATGPRTFTNGGDPEGS